MKKLFIVIIEFYQRYLSILSHGSCRYYPTCSEFTKIHFLHNNVVLAFFASFLRISRCNGFFRGGIEYPVVSRTFNPTSYIYTAKRNDVKILFWFVLQKNGRYYVIKTL